MTDPPLPPCGEAPGCFRAGCPWPDFEVGFGLAGGGYGPYQWCDVCGVIVAKTQLGPEADGVGDPADL